MDTRVDSMRQRSVAVSDIPQRPEERKTARPEHPVAQRGTGRVGNAIRPVILGIHRRRCATSVALRRAASMVRLHQERSVPAWARQDGNPVIETSDVKRQAHPPRLRLSHHG